MAPIIRPGPVAAALQFAPIERQAELFIELPCQE